MVIESELDFQHNQAGLNETVSTLFGLVKDIRGKDSLMKRSNIENWMKIFEVLRKEPFRKGMSQFSLATLCAYYISQKLMEYSQEQDQHLNQYTLFQSVSAIFNKSSAVEFKKTFSEYLPSLFQNAPAEQLEDLANRILPGVKLLQQIYNPIKGRILSVKSWESPSRERGFQEEHICDAIEESVTPRSMANVLEHIIKEMQEKSASSNCNLKIEDIPIEDIQNELVHAGLLFGQKSHPHYTWGSAFALPQLFDIGINQLLAWYLVDKIAKCLQCKTYAEIGTIPREQFRKIAEHLREIAKEDFRSLCRILERYEDKLKHRDFYRELTQYLRSIKQNRGFDGEEILKWCQGIRSLIAVYELCDNERRKRKERKERFMSHPLFQEEIRLLVVGDSASAGLRVPDRNLRWVVQLQRLCQEAGFPVKVINCSIAGFETAEGLEALPQYFRFFGEADLVVCPLGGNDAHKGKDLFEMVDNMIAFVDICKNYGIPPQHVVWGSGIPKTFDHLCDAYRRSFEGAMRAFARCTGAIAAPLPDHILSEENLDSDGIHFNEKIQKEIAEFAFKTVEPIIRKIWLTRLENSQTERVPSFMPSYDKSTLPQSSPVVQIPIQIPIQIPVTLTSQLSLT